MNASYVSAMLDPATDAKAAFHNVGAPLVQLYNALLPEVQKTLGDLHGPIPILFAEPPRRGLPAARLYVVYVREQAATWRDAAMVEKVRPWTDEQSDVPLFVIALRLAEPNTPLPSLHDGRGPLSDPLPPLEKEITQLAGSLSPSSKEFVLEDSPRNTRSMIMLLEQLIVSLK